MSKYMLERISRISIEEPTTDIVPKSSVYSSFQFWSGSIGYLLHPGQLTMFQVSVKIQATSARQHSTMLYRVLSPLTNHQVTGP